MGHYCKKRRVFTPEEQQLLDSVWANPDYPKRAKLLFKHAVERFALSNGQMEIIDPFDIFERDHWRCKRCNTPTPREVREQQWTRVDGRQPPHNLATLDHIIPIGGGGCHVASNCQLLCYQCNRYEKREVTGYHRGSAPPPPPMRELPLQALRK